MLHSRFSFRLVPLKIDTTGLLRRVGYPALFKDETLWFFAADRDKYYRTTLYFSYTAAECMPEEIQRRARIDAGNLGTETKHSRVCLLKGNGDEEWVGEVRRAPSSFGTHIMRQRSFMAFGRIPAILSHTCVFVIAPSLFSSCSMRFRNESTVSAKAEIANLATPRLCLPYDGKSFTAVFEAPEIILGCAMPGPFGMS